MAFNRAILRTYAQLSEPTRLAPSIYFTHTEKTVTIFDAYPKAVFHLLVLPRIKDKEGPLSAANLTSLKKFLNSNQTNRKDARELLGRLKEDGEKVREMVKEEMRDRYGFVWKVHLGFHAVQSMDHIHLHVISEDLCAPGLKTKKHYNSFHPKLGFFLHIDDVLSWFDEGNAESYMRSMVILDEASYEKKLKDPLGCFHCAKEFKNMPVLKTHLQEHFDEMAQKGKTAELDRKRRHNAETEENSKIDPDLKQEIETAKRKPLASDPTFEALSQIHDGDSDAPRKKQTST
ncbi:HNT3_3 [Sanghuangporus sanghuang]